MAVYEQELPIFTPKDVRRLGRLEESLQATDTTCFIDIFAIAHDWEPGEILDVAQSSDVVTLELTRGVVQAGLEGADSQVLDRSIFWKTLIEGLQEGKEEKLIRGVEVNQTARLGWKRLALSCGQSSASSALMTVEVNDPTSNVLSKFLPEEEKRRLRELNWITVDDQMIAVNVLNQINESYRLMRKGKIERTPEVPLTFPHNLKLVSDNIRRIEEYNDRFPVVFMKSPDQSLTATVTMLQEMLRENTSIDLTDQETKSYSLDIMLKFILSHAELKDAEEILNSVCQYALRTADNPRDIRAIHVGGADHAEPIRYALAKHIGNSNAIKVEVKKDPRFTSDHLGGSLLEFFRHTIPFEDRLKGIQIEGSEVYANPEFIVETARNAISTNSNDFEKRLLIAKIINKKLQEEKMDSSLEGYNAYNLFENTLYRMDNEDLQKILEGGMSLPLTFYSSP